MWYPYLQTVEYSYESGDESLPHLKELAGNTPDEHKDIILEYLNENCICACAGIVQDIVSPDKTIGCGSCFADDRYMWNDCFANYVERYNIPVPREFRNYILKNYGRRKQRHLELQTVDGVEVKNNPYLGCQYEVRIGEDGLISYKNNSDCQDGIVKMMDSQNGDWLIHQVLKQLFCYDVGERGNAVIDGYHWEIKFFRKSDLIYQTEGMNKEPDWRYWNVKQVMEFIERCIQKDMGSSYMDVKSPF